MTSWSTEALVDSTIDTLSAQLGPALDKVYAANADRDEAARRVIDYEAPRPGLAPDGDYHADAVSTILRYPCVEVSVADLNMTNFSLGLEDADAKENLIVLLWERSAAREITVLARKLRRLSAAAFDVLAQPGALAGAQIETVRAAWRWNPEAGERDELISGALLVFGLASTRVRP